MESRKRPHAEDEADTRAKKRALSDESRSPGHVNGVTADGEEPRDGDNLEVQCSVCFETDMSDRQPESRCSAKMPSIAG